MKRVLLISGGIVLVLLTAFLSMMGQYWTGALGLGLAGGVSGPATV